MSVPGADRIRRKLRRMRETLAAYERAEAMAADKARRQRYDIERREAELTELLFEHGRRQIAERGAG